MLGYMYGMNWGVVRFPFLLCTSHPAPYILHLSSTNHQVKTLATADVTPDEIQDPLFEDVRTGQLMLSLPPIPHHLRKPLRKYPPPKRTANPFVDIPPASPKTGLVRIDVRGYLANYGKGDGFKGDRAFGWHNLKTEKGYREAWEQARKDLGRKRLVWKPPAGLEFLARDL